MMLKNVYFIGIGGIGMSAIARYYKHAGYNVSGYDKTESKLTQTLVEEGICVHYTDDISFIPKEIDNTLVIYTPAIPNTLLELQYVKDNGYKLIKRSKALGEIAKTQQCLAVAGTHGKTTTSTMLAHIYTNSGVGCSAFLGGISKNYHTNLLLSNNPVLVAEADEFDRSFLQLYPNIALITSTDADHLDIYNDVKTIKEAFAEFASQVKADGSLIIRKGIDLDKTKIKAKVYTYSFEQGADFYPSNKELLEGGYFRFDLIYPGGKIEDCTVGIPGWINVENAIGASAMAILGGVPKDKIRDALKNFAGVERRFDIHINTPKLSYLDDYAHHPKEISSAITSIKNMFPNRKLTGIFQPHLYTRTRDFAPEFANSLSMLDEVILLDIYPARELPIEGVTSNIILEDITIKNKALVSKEDVLEVLKNKELDILITFGAGDIDRLIKPITQQLESRINNV